MDDTCWNAWHQRQRAERNDYLQTVLATRTAADPWFSQQCQQLETATASDQPLHLLFRAFGLAPRRLGKADLQLNDSEQAQLHSLVPGADPSRWSVDQAARLCLLLCAARHMPTPTAFASTLDELFTQADLAEQIALYQGFALLPHEPALLPRGGEAVRNGMRPVFAAFALRNPWPQYMLDEGSWNQMVVKAFFLDLPLWPVQGLPRRANPRLSAILCDLLDERRAAGREINPEIWYLLALCPDARVCAYLENLLVQGHTPHTLHTLQLALDTAVDGGDDVLQHEAAHARRQMVPQLHALRVKLASHMAQSGTDHQPPLRWQELSQYRE